jgi:hypothetical protein
MIEYRNLKPIYAGRNSRVYKARSRAGSWVAVKHYFQHHSDRRDRLRTEFKSLTYLQSHGIDNIPVPLALNYRSGWAAYSWIDGVAIPSTQIFENDIDQVVNFLCHLKIIAKQTRGQNFGPASEACFSLKSLKANLDHRIAALQKAFKKESEYFDLLDFFEHDLLPFYRCLMKKHCNSDALMTRPLERKFQTLSPSDFGFHNALKNESGSISFLDFEYFGWDDPAKIISDFCLHPAMKLSPALCRLFLKHCFDLFQDDFHLKARLSILFPFFGIKWCLILLNEFLPSNLSRRRFAGRTTKNASIIRRRQLTKSRNMLQRVINDSIQSLFTQ